MACVSADDKGLTRDDYGPSMIDRWKGRAFQQSPGGSTPCCGYEDEQVNWNGSSMTMGIKAGPVRVIRVTWGSDSGTNVTRTDIFYAYGVVHQFDLRVHPIPPLDGIYTQWDMAAGRVTTYYNPYNPNGVPITGINPVLLGDMNAHIGPDGISESSNDKLGRDERPRGSASQRRHPNNQTCTSTRASTARSTSPTPPSQGRPRAPLVGGDDRPGRHDGREVAFRPDTEPRRRAGRWSRPSPTTSMTPASTTAPATIRGRTSTRAAPMSRRPGALRT